MACFIEKQVGLGFSSFAPKLAKKRRHVVHVASSWRARGCEAKDDWFDCVGCGTMEVGPNYHLLDIIILLDHRGILVFSFLINRTLRVGREASIQLSLSHPLVIVAF
jgi:hypothetical protein